MPGPFYFAWAGGTIQEQQTLITNGNTHGGTVQTITIVGAVTAGSQQLTNLATNSGLEAGALHTISGPGVVDGTFFVFEDAVSGAPDSINLSAEATATLTSATYTVTKSIFVGAVAGLLTQGSNVVTLPDIDLPPGVYGIAGTGIGQVVVDTAPLPSNVFVSSAYFIYDGSGTAEMYLLVAEPSVSTITGPDGHPLDVTTYYVLEQEVTATSTGTYPLSITGMPGPDSYSVSSIPADALASLATGLRYNISGNGIQVGSTFLAPGSGTSVELDLPATSSSINAILTITGPRTPDAGFDPTVHNREDEQIVSIEIAQEEGGFATLSIELRNPSIGLLALGRNLWCWLSWDQAWTPDGGASPDLVPLFNGRLVGVPRLQAGEVIQLQFLGRPDDFNGQKGALLADMSVLPYYDPIWLASNVNPDTVLETYSALWHVDRTSLVVTTSDILQGEDGIVTIGEDQAFYDAFALNYGSPPLTAVTVSGTVSWAQQGEGLLDITQTIIGAFAAAGSPYKTTFPKIRISNSGGGGLISCLCGDGLKSDWPKPGTSIGGGWSLTTQNDGTGIPLCFIEDALRPTGWMQATNYVVKFAGQAPPPDTTGMTVDQSNIGVFTQPYGTYQASFPINIYKVRMTLEWRANRPRTETVTAVLTANVQRELSDSADSDREDIALTSEYVGQGVDPGGEVPIGSVSQRSYFQTDRGTASFEYLLLAARAKMRARARSVDISFAVDWPTALGITLRHSVTYLDRRLPGGTATGKVKSYKLTVGEAGMFGEFVIGCSIGNDDAATGATGTPSYVEDEYVDAGYQVIAGGQTMLLEDELAYETLDDFAVDDDGLDLTNMTVDRAVNECFVVNGLEVQLNKMATYQGKVAPTDGDPLTAMRTLSTNITLDLKPVTGGGFHTMFFPAVSQLWLPKTIDLAALSELDSSLWDAPAPSTWDQGNSTWDSRNA